MQPLRLCEPQFKWPILYEALFWTRLKIPSNELHFAGVRGSHGLSDDPSPWPTGSALKIWNLIVGVVVALGRAGIPLLLFPAQAVTYQVTARFQLWHLQVPVMPLTLRLKPVLTQALGPLLPASSSGH